MKKFFGLFVTVFMILGVGSMLLAQDAPDAAPVIDATQTPPAVVEGSAPPAGEPGKGPRGPKGPRPPIDDSALEAIDTTGVIEVTEPDAAKNQKYKNVLLKVGETTYRLIPSKGAKELFVKLESMAGKTVKVKGKLLPANEKFPMRAIKVDEFSE
ncbi:MAG: hypothetical protein EOM80_06085 [Erysipelotrichia bacterium]|nr:hypothetical protein [Candidatus Riflebacteria bacterium]NCB38324.1 hypothetical protein [Erysipelotrichia bacterium]